MGPATGQQFCPGVYRAEHVGRAAHCLGCAARRHGYGHVAGRSAARRSGRAGVRGGAMSAPTFTEALTQAEALARTKYPERAERITQAMALVKEGRLFQSNDGRWEVDSASTLAVQLSRK